MFCCLSHAGPLPSAANTMPPFAFSVIKGETVRIGDHEMNHLWKIPGAQDHQVINW